MKLLVIGDEYKNRRLLAFGLGGDVEFTCVSSPRDIERLYSLNDYAVALIDWEMKTWDASELLDLLRRTAPILPVVAMAASAEAAVTARRRGVADCVVKPLDIDKLRETLNHYASIRHTPAPFEVPTALLTPIQAPSAIPAEEEVESSAAEPSSLTFISQNPLMKKMLETAWRVAPTSSSILLLGENGTGKTVLASAIHQRSPRSKKPFVTVNCPCLKRELLESELFGHVRGSFTGAVNDAMGKVAAAEGGTLFLDEVGELPLDIQPKLLRLLQDREYERVGEPKARRANIRVIAATNRDLKAEVDAGRFREDLYYRLNVISLEVLPLRQRPEDIVDAAENFLASMSAELGKNFRGFTPMAREALQAYAWPGNLRELHNVIERAAILCDRDTLDIADFTELTRSREAQLPQVGEFVSLEELEEAHIREVVARAATFDHAARILGIDKSTLYRKRKRTNAHVDFGAENVVAEAFAG